MISKQFKMTNLYDFVAKRLTLPAIIRQKRYNAGIESHAILGIVGESDMNGVDA